MGELSDVEKDQLVKESISTISSVCKLHNLDFLSMPKDIKSILVSVYQQAFLNAMRKVLRKESL